MPVLSFCSVTDNKTAKEYDEQLLQTPTACFAACMIVLIVSFQR